MEQQNHITELTEKLNIKTSYNTGYNPLPCSYKMLLRLKTTPMNGFIPVLGVWGCVPYKQVVHHLRK